VVRNEKIPLSPPLEKGEEKEDLIKEVV